MTCPHKLTYLQKHIYLQRVGSQLFHSHILNHDVNPSAGTPIINMYDQDAAYSPDSCSPLFMCGLYINANTGVSKFPVPYQSLTLNLNPLPRLLHRGSALWDDRWPWGLPPGPRSSPRPPSRPLYSLSPRGAMLSNPPLTVALSPPGNRGLLPHLTAAMFDS